MQKIKLILKKYTEWLVEWFVFITAGILIICAINFSLFSNGGSLPKDTLWNILWSAFLTAAETAAFFMAEPIKKSSMAFCALSHFGCLTVTMLVCGIRFGWIAFDWYGIVEMAVSVAGVYAFVITAYYILDKRRAGQINRRLREKYKDDER